MKVEKSKQIYQNVSKNLREGLEDASRDSGHKLNRSQERQRKTGNRHL